MEGDDFRCLRAEFRGDSLFIGGKSIVEGWERPIQRRMAERAGCSRCILEVGYGIGMASDRLAELDVFEHHIIEAHPDVASLARKRLSCYSNTYLIEGFWENVIPSLPDEHFGAIIFDAYPYHGPTFDGSVASTMGFISPFLPASSSLLQRGGRLLFIDFSQSLHSSVGFMAKLARFSSLSFIEVRVEIPASCSYAGGNGANIIEIIK